MNYYNEFDPYAAQWLRNLISKGLIPAGDVDERSITDVRPDELKQYTQCHFFAGIGGWSYALQLAGWPPERPVWTGSCPCQPFSSAGRQKGKADDRHLWPVWFGLIRECRPPVVFGEQVSSAIAHGWLDDVYQGLEAEGYAVGAAVLPACSVGAPHKRDRLWFVADSDCTGSQGHGRPVEQYDAQGRQEQVRWDTEACVWIDCPDGKQRLIEPSIPLLAYGVSNRVGRLRAYGNAIVPAVASEFIQAFMECDVQMF
jgi:DNA (cytosine-5)-methyltransferase 1